MPTGSTLKYGNTGNRYVHEAHDQVTSKTDIDVLKFLKDQLESSTDPGEREQIKQAIKREEHSRAQDRVGDSDPRAQNGLMTSTKSKGAVIDAQLDLEDEQRRREIDQSKMDKKH